MTKPTTKKRRAGRARISEAHSTDERWRRTLADIKRTKGIETDEVAAMFITSDDDPNGTAFRLVRKAIAYYNEHESDLRRRFSDARWLMVAYFSPDDDPPILEAGTSIDEVRTRVASQGRTDEVTHLAQFFCLEPPGPNDDLVGTDALLFA